MQRLNINTAIQPKQIMQIANHKTLTTGVAETDFVLANHFPELASTANLNHGVARRKTTTEEDLHVYPGIYDQTRERIIEQWLFSQ